MAALDLRKKQPVPAPKANAINVGNIPKMPGSGMPLPAGTVQRFLPAEAAALEAVGWTEGDPIPDLSSLIAAIKADNEAPPVIDLGTAVKKPVEQDINDLPPEQRAKLLSDVQEMIARGKALAEQQQNSLAEPSADGVNEAILQASTGQERFRVTLNKPEVKKASETPADTATPATEAEQPTESPTGLDAGPERCTNCGFDHKSDTPADVTEEDKRGFLAMLHGGRFIKEYEIYGGTVKITFRTLTQKELDMTLVQTGCDMRNGLVTIPTDAEYMRRVQNYEQVLAIHRIVVGNKVETMPELKDVLVDTPKPDDPINTPLSAYYTYVMDNYVESSTMLRLITVLHMRFKALVQRLELNMHNVDFFSGIEPRA